METLSILCVLVGVLTIVFRAPLIFAPRATLRFFDRLVSTDRGVRGIALGVAPLALALVVLPPGQGSTAVFLRVLGWLFAAVTLWLLAAPGSYRSFSRGLLDAFEHSLDLAIVRIIGLVAVALGAALIYFGIYVV